jgi:hypothetical protein
MKPLFRICVAGICLAFSFVISACSRSGEADRDVRERAMMKPSVTYLHLLRHTPFFTSLDTSQLRWTIDHSREWEAHTGAVIATCEAKESPPDDAIWILLDGRWQVEEGGRVHPSGHADPGKWFSCSDVRATCRLVITEKSYVMRISRSDMDEMLARGFAFKQQLDQGQAYYNSMFPMASKQ